MDRRRASLVIGAVTVVCVAMVFTVLYPFSTSVPAANTAEEHFSIGQVDELDEYTVSGKYAVGGLVLEHKAIVSATGERYSFSEGDFGTSETYQRTPDSDVYIRYVVPDETEAEQRIDSIHSSNNRDLVRTEQTSDGTVIDVVEETQRDQKHSIRGITSLYISGLSLTSYERTQETETKDVYEPKGGWFYDSYRITNSSGEVQTDPDSLVVQSGNVSFEYTENADSYAHYLLEQQTGNGAVSGEVSYDRDTENASIDRPEWVEEIKDEQ